MLAAYPDLIEQEVATPAQILDEFYRPQLLVTVSQLQVFMTD